MASDALGDVAKEKTTRSAILAWSNFILRANYATLRDIPTTGAALLLHAIFTQLIKPFATTTTTSSSSINRVHADTLTACHGIIHATLQSLQFLDATPVVALRNAEHVVELIRQVQRHLHPSAASSPTIAIRAAEWIEGRSMLEEIKLWRWLRCTAWIVAASSSSSSSSSSAVMAITPEADVEMEELRHNVDVFLRRATSSSSSSTTTTTNSLTEVPKATTSMKRQRSEDDQASQDGRTHTEEPVPPAVAVVRVEAQPSASSSSATSTPSLTTSSSSSATTTAPLPPRLVEANANAAAAAALRREVVVAEAHLHDVLQSRCAHAAGHPPSSSSSSSHAADVVVVVGATEQHFAGFEEMERRLANQLIPLDHQRALGEAHNDQQQQQHPEMCVRCPAVLAHVVEGNLQHVKRLSAARREAIAACLRRDPTALLQALSNVC